jgi:hypothetical protein
VVQIGIRLLPVLVNFWEDFGGIQFYVNAALGPGKPPESFYTHLGIRNYFKRWVRGFVCRLTTVPDASRTVDRHQSSLCGATQHTSNPAGVTHSLPALTSGVLLR